MNKLLAGVIGTLALAGAANAQSTGSVDYTSNTVTDATTPFTTTLNIQQFNQAQYGTLQSIVLSLVANVSGVAQAENRSDEAETVGLKLSATERLRRPDGTDLVVAVPVVNTTAMLDAYDGTTDYAGPSGVTIDTLAGNKTETQTFTDAATLALFTGTGSVAAILRATGASQGTGDAGNEAFLFTTKAGGYAKVTYNYLVASVPEPGTWLMMITGFGLVGMGVRRRGAAPIFG